MYDKKKLVKSKEIINAIRNRNTTAFKNCKTIEELEEVLNDIFENEVNEIRFYLNHINILILGGKDEK